MAREQRAQWISFEQQINMFNHTKQSLSVAVIKQKQPIMPSDRGYCAQPTHFHFAIEFPFAKANVQSKEN